MTLDIPTSNNQILAFKVSDSSIINMTPNNSYQYRYPVFKPNDNDYIYYVNVSIGNSEIFRSDIATQTQVQLRATGTHEIRNILFNEDGSKLLCNLRNPTGSIWSISYVLTSNYAGSFVELVNRSTNPIYEMNWNYNFTKLCFASDVGGVSQLFECDIDGSNLTQRTTGANNKRCPVYSPDGTKILFRRQSGADYPIWSADTTYDMSGYFDNQAVWIDETGNRIESPIDWKDIIT